jgi:Methyltransferase domain
MTDHKHVEKKIDQYLKFNFYRTEGFMSRLDALVFRELVTGQIKHAIKGSLAEIGVHYGRSFFLLALGRFGSEKVLGVDLFEDDALHTNLQGIGRFGGFRSNCHKYRFDFSEDEILKSSSLEIGAEEIVRRVGQVRFFSIDGGHMYKHVDNDLRLAKETLTRDGVICLDDILNVVWPEVAIAAFDWLRTTGNRFVPFLVTDNKLYLCDSSYASFYLAMIREDKKLNSMVFRSISLLSHEVVVLLPSATSRLIDRVLDSSFSIGRRALNRPTGKKGQGSNTLASVLTTPKSH